VEVRRAMSGILKRKFEEVEASSSPCSSLRESDDEVSCSESGDSSDSVNPSASGPFTPDSILKREKRLRTRRVHFENVTVYYFSRRQGFTSVPSQGGSTLGMSNRHSWIRQYSLGEFALEQERIHRDMLRDHLKEEKLNSIKLKANAFGFLSFNILTKNGTVESEEADTLTAEDISDDDIDLDNTEVDRMSFPCGCTKEGCSNSTGRVEFNPIRVRTHFLHTIMKLELEKSREQQQASSASSYQGETNDLEGGSALVPSQHRLDYSLSDAVQQTASMHMQQAADAMEEPLEEDEEEDDEEDEGEEEEEENEDDEDDEDSSSICSGLSDSSTQSLANSDSEEEEDDEDEEKPASLQDDMAASPVSHTEVVSLSSVLCYSDGSVVHDNHMSGHAFLMNASPTEYYQLEKASAVSGGPQPSKTFEEALAFQDPISTTNGSVTQGPFGLPAEQYTNYSNQVEELYPASHHFALSGGASTNPLTCYGSDPAKLVPEQPDNQTQTQFENYLNNNTASPFSSRGSGATAEQPRQES
ncbi:unnamed protein product, partial [Tetraodon nigroviridis]